MLAKIASHSVCINICSTVSDVVMYVNECLLLWMALYWCACVRACVRACVLVVCTYAFVRPCTHSVVESCEDQTHTHMNTRTHTHAT